jgi:RNA polymerase sigma-70 factor (ECF subfamily)
VGRRFMEDNAPMGVEAQTALRAKVQLEVTSFYKSTSKGLFRYLLCLTKDIDLAQEAVQETFLRYYEFRLDGGSTPQARGWFFRVARNYIIDQIRATKPNRRVSIEEGLSVPDYRYCPHNTLVRTETLDRLSAILTGRELECLQLRVEGFKYKEIAQVLGIESGTVGATIAHGLKKIRAFYVANSKEAT